MSTLLTRIQAYAQESHPFKDSFIILLSLLLVVSVDLTAYPETPAVIVYQLFLLIAVAAFMHILYIHRFKRKIR